MGYSIQLDAYQGPFDLLLDLIAQNEIDIWDIPIARITEQYLQYLYSLQEQDLAITGEFLVMAATLIRIKSRLLLPEEPTGEEDCLEEEDPRVQLVEQLLRYKFFKDVAEVLQGRYQEAVHFYTRGQAAAEFDVTPIYTFLVGDLTVGDLERVYQELITETESEPFVHNLPTRISLQERLALVRLQMVGQPRLSFLELLQENTSEEIVVTFLAVLELVHLGEVAVVQTESFGEINIKPFALELEVQL